MEIIVRKATVKDIPTLVKMWKEFMKEHDSIVTRECSTMKPYCSRKQKATSMFKRFIQKNIRSPNSIVLVAETNGKPAGYCLSQIKKGVPIYTVGKLGHISDLFVTKKFRGSGISSRFKQESFKWFRQKGLTYSSIMVSPYNKKAKSIYKNWGFEGYHLEMRRKI